MHLRTLVTVGALVGALLVSSAARASLPPPSAPPAVAHFWTALEPYGTWIDAPGIGWCWQPSVAVVGAGWTPYTRGHWVYADVGWTWVSDFGWGWAPFHYGGWVDDAVWGWVWVPGDIWTPAWVEWRVGGGYVGWAPRPPASLPHPRAVVVGAPRGWTFVAAADFLAPNVYVRAVAPLRVNAVFAMTRPIVEARFVGGARVFVGPPLPFIRAHAGVPSRRCRSSSCTRARPCGRRICHHPSPSRRVRFASVLRRRAWRRLRWAASCRRRTRSVGGIAERRLSPCRM